MQNCVVLAYTAFDPVATARTYMLPVTVYAGTTTPLNIGFVAQPGRIIYYYGTMNGSPTTVVFNTLYQFRYVIIPGGVAIGAGGRIASGPAAGYTVDELKNMSYDEVARKFNIPATGSNIRE
jgi:hypothetical protein